MNTESTLEITIQTIDNSKFRVFASANGSTAQGSFSTPDSTFINQLYELQRGFVQSNRNSRSVESTSFPEISNKSIATLGDSLFKMVFKDSIKSLYTSQRDETVRQRNLLRIKFINEAPTLSFVPWEILFDEEIQQFLSCYQYTLFTRGTGLIDLPHSKITPITILGMAARPEQIGARNLYEIRADKEQQRITKALSKLEIDGHVHLHWTPSSNKTGLIWRIEEPPQIGVSTKKGWDVFHFIGHGGTDDAGNGFLIVQEDGGYRGDILPADDLVGLLACPNGPELVVLSSCSGAQAKPGELFSDTAKKLTLAGIPAVVAMQSEISDEAAIVFVSAFYEALARRKSVQQALTFARIQLRASKWSTEWPVPVLYLRSSGQMFQQL